MGRITPHRSEPPSPRPADAPSSEEERPRLALGWRIALIVWAIGFGGLMLFEVGAFLWRVLGGLFVSRQ